VKYGRDAVSPGSGPRLWIPKPQAIRVGLPTRSGGRGPRREADPEDSVPELEGAIGIVGWEFDQRRGHGRSMASASCSLLLRPTSSAEVGCQSRSDALIGIIGARRAWTVTMISGLSMPCRYTEVMPRSLWPSWRLDHDQRHAFASHLDGVRVPELMRREAPPDTSRDRCPAEFGAGGGAGPPAAASGR
jgi:hypothetical protein